MSIWNELHWEKSVNFNLFPRKYFTITKHFIDKNNDENQSPNSTASTLGKTKDKKFFINVEAKVNSRWKKDELAELTNVYSCTSSKLKPIKSNTVTEKIGKNIAEEKQLTKKLEKIKGAYNKNIINKLDYSMENYHMHKMLNFYFIADSTENIEILNNKLSDLQINQKCNEEVLTENVNENEVIHKSKNLNLFMCNG